MCLSSPVDAESIHKLRSIAVPNLPTQTLKIKPTVEITGNGNSAHNSNAKLKFDLEERLLSFAVSIVELTEILPSTRAGNHIAGQLLRCGTSPLSNHGEVEAAESRKDFVHKLKICLKELRETKRWLRLVARLKKLGNPPQLLPCLNEADELIRIFVASIRTARSKTE